MTLGERIKKLRKALDLTQQKFADRLGMKRNSIAQVEMGRSTSDQTIKGICREFSVSEEWLRTGAGEMFVPAPKSEFEALAAKYPGTAKEMFILIEKIITLPKEKQNVIIDFIKDTADGFIQARQDLVADHPSIEEEADEFAAKAREQFLAEKRRESKAYSANESAGA